MPNWCNNVVELSHEDTEMIQRAKRAFTEGKLLNEFIPVPEDLHIVAGRVGDDSDPKQIELEAAEKRNIEKYGYKTWYDFCVAEWGTKWDVGGDDGCVTEDSPNKLTMSFDSAWSPPVDAYVKLEELGFQVRAYYYEPGMCFAGIYEDGSDDCYSDWGDSQGAKDTLPEALDEMFCISESQAEWEAEEAE